MAVPSLATGTNNDAYDVSVTDYNALVRGVRNRITPYMFAEGVVAYTTLAEAQTGNDSAATLQAMFDYWADNPEYEPDLMGLFWPVTEAINIQQLGPGHTTSRMHAGSIVAKTGTSGDDLIRLNWPAGEVMGKLQAFGTGGSTYTTRTWKNGIKIIDSPRLRLESWHCQRFARHALVVGDEEWDGGVAGNNIALVVGPGKHIDCGSAGGGGVSARKITYTFDSVTRNGSQGSVNQTATVHFNETLDPNHEAHDLFLYTEVTGGRRTAMQASSIDFGANTITFYYWPENVSSGTMDSAHGGGLYLYGENTASSTFGRIDGIGCGTNIWDRASYGAVFKHALSQDSGINVAFGRDPGSLHQGGSVETRHAESTYLDIAIMGPISQGCVFGVASSQGAQTDSTNVLEQTFKASPRNTADTLNNNGMMMGGVTIHDDHGWVLEEAGPLSYTAPLTTITLSNRPHERWHKQVNSNGSQDIVYNLDFYDSYARIKRGNHWCGFQLFGDGASGGVDQITVQLPAALITAGYTLNGGTSALVYSSLTHACIGYAVMDLRTKNWKFALHHLADRVAAQTDSVAADVATLKADFNALLAKMRTAGLLAT